MECIRYALEIPPKGKNARKQHEEILKENLGKEKGRLERFLPADRMEGQEKLGEIHKKLQDNQEKLVTTQSVSEEIEAQVARLPRLEEQAKQFKALGLEDKLKVVPLLEREKNLGRQAQEELDRVDASLQQLREDLPDLVFLSDKALEGLPDDDLLKELRGFLDTLKQNVELHISHEGKENYRSLDRLSTGQQCTAILHLLLLDNRDPLILDQPEDNLDNAFIADRIVVELREAKLKRQFLFATHNANIPVFGDTEWIGIFSVMDSKANMPPEDQGSIDVSKIRASAADILEGGRAAFVQRKEKYGF